MQCRNREETVAEIDRVEKAIRDTRSPHLERDYRKHLNKLYKSLRYYDTNYSAK